MKDSGYSAKSLDSRRAFFRFKITTLPAQGELRLNGVAVAAGDFVTVADIGAGKLKFLPDANEHEIGRASCRERVQISVVAVSLKKKQTQAADHPPRSNSICSN